MSSFKVDIKNFQSIGEAHLSFDTGVTAVVGPSNSGKSGIIRAISAVLTNTSDAKYHIKHGEASTEVCLSLDGNTVIWERTPKDSTYDINGTYHQKVGKTDLFELLPDNGFYLDDCGNIINIQDEWATLFPFDRTDSQAYKLFEDIFAVNQNDSVRAMKQIKDDEAETKKSIVELEAKIKNNTDKVAKIDTFLANNSGKHASNLKEAVIREGQKFQELDNDTESFLESMKVIQKLSKIKRIEFDLNDLNSFIELDKDVRVLEEVLPILNIKIHKEDYSFNTLPEYLELDKDVSCVLELLKEIKQNSDDDKALRGELGILKESLDAIKVCPLCGHAKED